MPVACVQIIKYNACNDECTVAVGWRRNEKNNNANINNNLAVCIIKKVGYLIGHIQSLLPSSPLARPEIFWNKPEEDGEESGNLIMYTRTVHE